MLYSRLSKLIVQSFRAAKQYVFSACTFSGGDEDKMDEIDTLVLEVLRALRNLKSKELKDAMEGKIHDKLKIIGLEEYKKGCEQHWNELKEKMRALRELKGDNFESMMQELQDTLTSTKENSSPKETGTNKQNSKEMHMPNIGAPRNDPYASFFSVWRRRGKAKAPTQDATQKAGYVCIITKHA